MVFTGFEEGALFALETPTGCPVLLIGCTAAKSVFRPNTRLKAGEKNKWHEINEWKHGPSACAPVCGGVAALAAA